MNSKSFKLHISDPSGESRTHTLKSHEKIGRDPALCTLVLRDPTLPMEAAELWWKEGQLWIRSLSKDLTLQIGGIPFREGSVPVGTALLMGETRLTLTHHSTTDALPVQPTSTRHWQTCTTTGIETLWMTKKAADTPLSIYLGGETGTGKEVLAHLIHAWSPRAAGHFVPLHCGALALSLVESELFGHVKGAFTGAHHHRPGALMQAHNGTLFLDEVGDLPLDIQVKLLRFLENGEIRPVGADRSSRADVRIICATHLPLEQLVEEGKFRRDLYYRLASVTIQIPTLRSRPDDIGLLAHQFAQDLKKSLSPSALLRLQAHSWPGNVRELRHAIERACGLAGALHEILGEEHFSFLLNSQNTRLSPALELNAPILKLSEMERIMLLRALRLSHGNRTAAAKILGVARSTLFEMLKRHRIQGPRHSEDFVSAVYNAA